MTEILYIFLQFLIFVSLFSLNILALNIKFLKSYKISFLENLSFNIVVHANLLLFLSFLNLELNKIITYYLFINLIILFFCLIRWKTIYNFFHDLKLDLLILSFICLVLFFNIANNLVLSWDAEKFWFYKTLNFYNGNSIENLKNLPNSFYPYLGNLIWATFWKISLINQEYSGRLLYVFIYCVALLNLIENIQISKIFKLIFILLFFLITYDYYITFSGNQEIIIFSLIAICMNYFYKLKNKNKNKNKNFQNYYITSILLACSSLIWIKQEGLIYSFIIILTLLIFFNLNLKKRIFVFVFYAIFVFLKIFVYKNYNLDTSIHPGLFNDLSLGGILNKITIDRIIVILQYFFFAFLKNHLLIIGLIFSLLLIKNKKLFIKNYYLFFYLILNFLFVFTAYLMTDVEIEFMLKTGIDRLIFSFSPFIFLIFIEYINSIKYKN